MRFLGLGLGNRGPDAKTVRLYQDALAQAGKVEVLFGLFDGHLSRQGYIARGGQILDACIVPVLRNHKTRNHSTHDKNAAIKRGELPGDWADRPTKRCQKDLDARWSEADQKTVRGTVFPPNKHGKNHYGYKNHMNVDRTHKLVRRCQVSDAAVHDSQAVDQLLMQGNTGSGTWADAACRSEEMKAKLRDRKLKSHIHRKGKRDKPLTGQAKVSNRTKSTSSATVRVRVEYIFGAQTNNMGGTLVRTIGLRNSRATSRVWIRCWRPSCIRNARPERPSPAPSHAAWQSLSYDGRHRIGEKRRGSGRAAGRGGQAIGRPASRAGP
jgi:IS5 family transposase